MSRRSKDKNGWIIKSVAVGTVSSIIASVVLLVVFSVFMMIQQMPIGGGMYISFIIISLAAFVGGYVAARCMGCKGMITGGLVGLTYIMLVALIGGAAGFAINLFGTFMLKIILSVLFGGIGGVLKMNIRRR